MKAPARSIFSEGDRVTSRAPQRGRRGSFGPTWRYTTFTALHRLAAGCLLLLAIAYAAPSSADQRLLAAAEAGDRELTASLLEQGVDPAFAGVDGTTALHLAAHADDLALAQLLLAHGAPAEVANRYGVTPLMLAASHGDAALLSALLEAGADASLVMDDGLTPLMAAARAGSAAALELLLTRGADPNAHESRQGETALIWAAAENNAAAVRTLVTHGADVNARSDPTTHPAHRFGDGIVAVRMTLPHGHWTPLMYAAREGALDAARALLAAGADADLADPQGLTALMHAINNAHYDVAAALLEGGADPMLADVTGVTPLYAAVDMMTMDARPGRPAPKPSGDLRAIDVIRLLLEHGADPNPRLATEVLWRQHSPGDTALGEGSTPLLRAAKTPVLEAIRLLLGAGADPTLTTATGTTAIMFAAGPSGGRLHGDFPVSDETKIAAIDLFAAAGVALDARDAEGRTALHTAAADGNSRVVSALLERGAEPTATDAAGRTPLEVARAAAGGFNGGPGHAEVVAILDARGASPPTER